jgi:hypothetical protein
MMLPSDSSSPNSWGCRHKFEWGWGRNRDWGLVLIGTWSEPREQMSFGSNCPGSIFHGTQAYYLSDLIGLTIHIHRSLFYAIEETASRYLFVFASYSKIKTLKKSVLYKVRCGTQSVKKVLWWNDTTLLKDSLHSIVSILGQII